MSATLTIQVPDELWECLSRTAAQQGKTPELLAAEYLANLTPKGSAGAFRRWAGGWASNVPDASIRHDEYLGQSLHKEIVEPGHD